ncbi:MAG: ABC transporter ATP-binding protein [Chloroflexi bacterium]|nr:ABC transporter ATP-binding protein [Chloroflexota bacterium]
MRPGEFVSLIGPSGCGKTTALRIVAGLLEQTSGTVTIDGSVSTGPSRDKAIVFQHFNLLPWRTAIDNVAYGLELQGMPKAKRMQVATEYLDLVGLTESAQKYPSQLSGGMRQRIGIARALAIDPKLLLMDEPFGALDALTREHLQGQLARICQERNLTTLFVTHSIDEAIYLSDRVVVMGVQPGRIIAEFHITMRKPRGDYNFRAEPEYAQVREDIWRLLEQQIVRAERVA